MAVTTDIMRTWRGPRTVMRDLLNHGQREDRALAYLMAACIMIFIAQWPRLSRIAAGFDGTGAETQELSQLVGTACSKLHAFERVWQKESTVAPLVCTIVV